MAAAATYVIAGGSGVGVSLARRLLATQPLARVHLLSRRAAEHAAALGDGRVTGTVVDLANAGDAEAAAASVSAGAAVAGFIYAAGSIPLAPLRRLTADDLLRAFTLNTASAIMMLKAVLPAMPPTGAAVLFSSVAATTGFPNHVAIATAKAGLEGAARSIAVEMLPRRINVIAPSLTMSPLGKTIVSSDAAKKAVADAHPLSRLGSIDDLVESALFLLDDAKSGWMTGQVLHVDGGRSSLRHK